jgi:hypothetical protein
MKGFWMKMCPKRAIVSLKRSLHLDENNDLKKSLSTKLYEINNLVRCNSSSNFYSLKFTKLECVTLPIIS